MLPSFWLSHLATENNKEEERLRNFIRRGLSFTLAASTVRSALLTTFLARWRLVTADEPLGSIKALSCGN